MRPPFPDSAKRLALGDGIIRETATGETDPAALEKDDLESRIVQVLSQFWLAQLERIRKKIEPKVPASRKAVDLPSVLNSDFWDDEERELLAVLLPLLEQAAAGGVDTQARAIEAMGIGVDWTQPHTEAATWARRYGGKLIRGVTRTTRDRVGVTVGNWVETPGANLHDLWTQLQKDHGFSERRSKLIAITETTSAFSRGEMAAAAAVEKEGLFELDKTWLTVRDDVVCPLCGPLHNTSVRGSKANFTAPNGQQVKGPPMHPGCRCFLAMTPVWQEEAGEEAAEAAGWAEAPIFASNRDAAQWIAENLKTPIEGTERCDKNWVQAVAQEVYKVEQVTGKPLPVEAIQFGGIRGKEYGHWDPKTNKVRLRKTLQNWDERRDTDNARWMAEVGGDVPFHANDSPEGLFYHELGHAFDGKQGEFRRMVRDLPLTEKRQLLKLSGYVGEDLLVSAAAHGGSEGWAEAFATIAVNGERAQYVPDILRRAILELLGRTE